MTKSEYNFGSRAAESAYLIVKYTSESHYANSLIVAYTNYNNAQQYWGEAMKSRKVLDDARIDANMLREKTLDLADKVYSDKMKELRATYNATNEPSLRL